mgnify:FL=1
MKILTYEIKNVRGIDEMKGQLDGKSVYVVGKNGSGKSSFIQAIFLAFKLFGNKPYLKKGEDKGQVKVQIGNETIEYTIERTFTESGDTILVVKDSKGKKIQTPQKFLDNLLGTSMYYLSEFLEADPKKQVKLFKEWFNINTDELDKKYKETYDKRHIEGMEETRLKKVVEGYHYTYDDQKKYAKEKDVTELSQKLVAINQIENEQIAKGTEVKSIEDKIEEKTRLINTYEQNEIRYEQEIKDMEEKIGRLKTKIKKTKKSREVESVVTTKLGKELTQAKEAYAAIEVPDKIEIEEELAEVSEWNKTVAHVAKYTADLLSLQAQEKVYRDLTEELREIEKAKKKKLEDAEIPVEGLSFDENTLIYEDKPLVKDVVNDAKIAEVILTLLLRTNKNQQEKTGEDKLSIFRLNGGDLTDSTFNAIMAIVQKEDGEVFVEIPDDDQEEMAIKFIEHA